MTLSPAALSNITTATQLISNVGGIASELQEAGIKTQAQEFAAGAELFNADIARQEARIARAKAKIEIGRRRKSGESLLSEQRALYAASGVRVDVGTPLVVMQDTLEEIEMDILIMQFNADVEAQRLESEARQAELRAEQRRYMAGQEKTAGYIRAGARLLEATELLGKFKKTGD